MKIACISDIHGNKEALDNVLYDINKKGANITFCLGDIAMGGYDPNYTIEKLFSYKNIDIIQGNTDKLIANYSDDIFNNLSKSNPLMASALKLDVSEIKESNKKLLSNLCEQKTVKIGGEKILLCHGSPRRQDENIYPDTNLDELENIVRSYTHTVRFFA